jgi:hypothetical protein
MFERAEEHICRHVPIVSPNSTATEIRTRLEGVHSKWLDSEQG